MARTRILTLSALAAVLGACSALAGPGPAAEVAPVVVWAQAAVGGPSDSADTDFRSRFGLFADQSESTAAWPGPAWDRSGAPAASERSGEAADGDSQRSRAAQLASYVTHLTEQGFSSGDQLSFDQTPTPGDQTPTPSERNQQAEAEQRSDAGGEPGGQDQGPADGRASDAEEGSASAGHSARLALLRQRRKKLRLSAARDPARLSVIRRRQKPAAAEKSEEPATDSTSDQQDTEAKDSATEAPRLRRPFGLRRRRPVHSPSHQRRRRPTQQSTTETSATSARRPSRRRRPTRPPTSTARPTEEPAATQPADAGTEETVYYKPSAEEYPDYPPFAPPREPTQAPQPPLQAPQLASPGSGDTAQAAQQPGSDSLQQFSDQPGPPNGGESDTEQNLTDKVTKLKQKLAEEKEQNENELSSEGVAKPIVPSLPAEQVTTRPLRELFDVLTKAELARGPRRENYGPAAIQNGREPPRQSVAASIRRPNVQRFQVTRPQVHGDRQSPSPAFQGPRPQSVQASSERTVPSEVVYESGFKPITDTSRFSAPQSQPSAGPQASAAPPQPPQSQRVEVSGTFVSGERRPTQVPSRPTFAAPQQQPSVVHTVRRPVGPPAPAPAPEKKATSGGKIRFPGADESTSHQQSSVLPRPPPSFGQRPRPGQTPARPGSLPPFGANPSENVRRPESPPDQRPFPGFPPRQHLGAGPTQFPSGPKNSGHPRPPTDPAQQHFGVQRPGGSPRPSGDGGQRPSTSHLPDSPRPFGGAHRFAGGSVQSRPGAISGSTPFPPFQGRPIGPPVHRNQNRPPPFSTQSTERTPPQSFGGLPEPPFRRPRPGPPQRRPLPKGRPQGPPFNQLTSGPPSKDRTRFPPSPSGPSSDGRLPLPTHPDNRQEASQVTEKSVQEQRPSPPPRPPRPSASFGLQRPPSDFQQRPPGDFQQRPSNGFQQRPPNNFQQRPNGLQRRPTSDFQQRPPNDFQQRPPSDFQQRPHSQFEQNPSERPPRGPDGQRRPPTGQRRPPFGFQQRPSETDEQTRPPPRVRPSGAPDRDRHPFEFQQRPSESSPDGPRPRPELQRRPPPGFRRPPPAGFQSRPPPGFRPGPGQFGQRLPPRPGSGLPGSAHPRRPSSSEGPLADLLTRRRDQQAPGQLLLQRG